MDSKIVNAPDIDAEIRKIMKEKKKILLFRVLRQVIVTGIVLFFVYQILWWMYREQVLMTLNSKLFFEIGEWKRICWCVYAFVLCVSIFDFLINYRYKCSREDLENKGLKYSEEYLNTVKMLLDANIINVYEAGQKNSIWFDYVQGDGLVKNIGIYMNVIYQIGLKETEIDFVNRTVSFPYISDSYIQKHSKTSQFIYYN